MKTLTGLNVIANETKKCNNDGTHGCVEIAYDFNNNVLYATWRINRNDYSDWSSDGVKNLFYTSTPMTESQIEETAQECIAEIERINELEAEEMAEYEKQCESEEML